MSKLTVSAVCVLACCWVALAAGPLTYPLKYATVWDDGNGNRVPIVFEGRGVGRSITGELNVNGLSVAIEGVVHPDRSVTGRMRRDAVEVGTFAATREGSRRLRGSIRAGTFERDWTMPDNLPTETALRASENASQP